MTRGIVFNMLIGGFLLWAVMCFILFSRLKGSHPREYAAMGSPGLLPADNGAKPFNFFGFVLRREHKSLEDQVLSLVSDVMFGLLIAYSLLFVALFFSIWR